MLAETLMSSEQNFGHAALKIQYDTLNFFFTQRRYLLFSLWVWKLWSEAAWFRFWAHLSFAISSILNFNLYLLPFEVWFRFVPLWTNKRSFRHTLTNKHLSFFRSHLFAFDQYFCFNYGYQCNNQIVWCAINRNEKYKQSKLKRK